MSIRRIVSVHDDNPVLRAHARPVRRVDRRIRSLMHDMLETMRDANGVGLAAPQIGLDLRVIVLDVPEDLDDPDSPVTTFTLADPEIVWASVELVEGREACLSIPDLFGDVPRHTHVRVRALDRNSRRIEIDLRDFEARVVQHEIDHLHGILFPDRVTGLEKLYLLEENDEGEWVKVPYEVPVL